MVEFSVDKYKFGVQLGKEPDIYDMWLKHGSFKDTEGLGREGTPIYIGVGQGQEWYDIIIAFRSDPIDYGGFTPGLLLVPETDTLFIGAGTTLRTYDLKNKRKKFEKLLPCGFWGWSRHDQFIIMQEELEFGIYTLDGYEKWSNFVEPPWTFEIEEERVKLDVMDVISYRNLRTGELVQQ